MAKKTPPNAEPKAEPKDELAGKTFMLARVETELLEERYGRAAEIDAQARELAGKAESLRRYALQSVLGHACERAGIPEGREVEWLMKDGAPTGFVVRPAKAPPAKS